MKRCGASGLRVETHRDIGLGATGPRLFDSLKHWLALAQQWKSGYYVTVGLGP